MKEGITKALTCGIVLYFFSLILGIILLPIGFLYVLATCISKRKYKAAVKLIDRKFKRMAIEVDILANVTCEEVFNNTLIKDGGYRFGNYGETISEVLGWNLVANNLTKRGLIVVEILNIFHKKHCLKAVNYSAK